MKASELRIGNRTTNGIVINIFEDHFYTKVGGTVYNSKYHDAKPIPLTEKWMLKFGFERHHADYVNDIIYIKNVPDNTEFEWGVYPNKLGSGVQIQNRNLLKYVHQLQNLYFALVGEELTFKS